MIARETQPADRMRWVDGKYLYINAHLYLLLPSLFATFWLRRRFGNFANAARLCHAMPLSTRDLTHRPAPRVGKSGFAAKSFTGPCFPVAADACICSRGCPTTACPRCKQAAGMGLGSWGCKRSFFCDNDGIQSRAAATNAGALPRVTLLAFLTFRAAYVRNVFAKKPQRAYIREVRRISHLASSVRRVGSRLPFHCVVAGDRNQTQERHLESVGVRIVSGRCLQPYLIEAATRCDRGCNPMSQRPHPYDRTSFLEPPRWASKWHKQSFNKLGALAMTQFDKVIVLPNPNPNLP